MTIKAETSTTSHKRIRLTAAQVIEALGKRLVPEHAEKVRVGVATKEAEGEDSFALLGDDQVIVVEFDVTRGGAR
jgi:hypothetical protein